MRQGRKSLVRGQLYEVGGLLGVDFLRAFDIAIHVRRGYIEVE